jgi:hypothetical protein
MDIKFLFINHKILKNYESIHLNFNNVIFLKYKMNKFN